MLKDSESLDSITSLHVGDSVEVIREFRDYDGGVWTVGTRLNGFKSHSCVPYHGGHTLYFANCTLRLCDLEPDNNDVLFQSGKYFRAVEF